MGTSKKGAMAKDTVIYMLAKGIEGVVGVVTMSVMTYLFATFQMGLYSTVNIAITTIGMVAIQACTVCFEIRKQIRYFKSAKGILLYSFFSLEKCKCRCCLNSTYYYISC